MEEEKEVEQIEEIKDDGKIHFPISGIIISGVLLLIIIALVVVILILRGQGNA